MKASLVAIILLVGLTNETSQIYSWDDPQSYSDMCRSFGSWQQKMRSMGQPLSAYAGTGLERICPNMV